MILIIDKSKASAKKYADTLYYIGMPTLALTPNEALSHICGQFAAILILNPDALPDIHDYVRRIREYAYSIPVFALYENPFKLEYSYLFDAVYRNTYISELINKIRDYCREKSLRIPGDFRLSGIDASVNLGKSTYLWKPINLTKTENMILRVFIASYPKKLSAKELLALAFKKSRAPEPSNIRAHISIMNRKFREIIGKNLFACALSGGGYQILTPEILEERKLIASNNNTSPL